MLPRTLHVLQDAQQAIHEGRLPLSVAHAQIEVAIPRQAAIPRGDEDDVHVHAGATPAAHDYLAYDQQSPPTIQRGEKGIAGTGKLEKHCGNVAFPSTVDILILMTPGLEFGPRLRELRKAKNLSQRELAEKVTARLKEDGRGFDFTYLSKIESEKAPPPSVAVITELAHALGADPDELVALAGKASPKWNKVLKESESARTFFRSALNATLTEKDWQALVEELKRRAKT